MRMIVEAFKETLELGLHKPDQIVVCAGSPRYPRPLGLWTLALSPIWILHSLS